jgi:altronate hydrolase
MFARMTEDMDINAAILTGGVDGRGGRREIYDMWLRVASGERSKSEAQGLGDEFVPWHEFVPYWQIGAVM